MLQSGSIKNVDFGRGIQRDRETMIMGMLPAKQLNHEDRLAGPTISSVAPSGVAKNVTSDRRHDD